MTKVVYDIDYWILQKAWMAIQENKKLHEIRRIQRYVIEKLTDKNDALYARVRELEIIEQ